MYTVARVVFFLRGQLKIVLSLFHWTHSELRVPFEHEGEAEVAYNTLRIDSEVPRSGVTKDLVLDRNMLVV